MNQTVTSRLKKLRAARGCGAGNRAGQPCQCPAIRGRMRCRLHGGLSPGAPKGGANGKYKDGYFTAEAIAERRWAKSLVADFVRGRERMTDRKLPTRRDTKDGIFAATFERGEIGPKLFGAVCKMVSEARCRRTGSDAAFREPAIGSRSRTGSPPRSGAKSRACTHKSGRRPGRGYLLYLSERRDGVGQSGNVLRSPQAW
ncbi:HGGxSTG domain-containing protein [Bradyrhizobium cenepequi]|uniref:HGGxSTG domain-containing protein n=1 Tax=Bradyrhizobium cenepequi TaxID=2821403 RepID=UPI0024C03C82|nr:HGGxSTG domain-containing protein [Bradyrhizobium cenepequi]